jgi:hypothetical protein
MEPPELDGASGPDSSRPNSSAPRTLRRFWKWIVAIVLVPTVGAVVAEYLKSGVDSGVKAVKHAVSSDSGPAPPFTVQATLGPPPNLDYCGGLGVTSWVFAQRTDRIRLPTAADEASPDTLTRWAARTGGVPADGSFIRMTFTATGPGAVVLQAMRVVVVNSHPLRRGASVYFSGGCGPLTSNFYAADLDRQPPGAVVAMGGTSGPPDFEEVPAAPFPLSFNGGTPESVYLELNTRTCTCDVYVAVDWQGPTSSGTLTIKDTGDRPFRIASAGRATETAFPDVRQHTWQVSKR